MPDFALITCCVLPEPDPDEAPLLAACAAAGLDVEMAAWDDAGVDWSRFGAVKLHSCWNYYEDPESFRSWIERASNLTRLWNPKEMVLRNLDKRYLGELESAEIPIVPTWYLKSETDLLDALEQTDWLRFVVKPTVSAASYMTKRFTRDEVECAQKFVGEILATREAMMQPYIESVESGGEVSLIHIDGELTHCITKQPRFTGSDEKVSEGFQPNEAMVAAAEEVIATIKEPWLYARVDLMEAAPGQWLLSELELVEPTLFLLQHPPAVERLVAAMKRI